MIYLHITMFAFVQHGMVGVFTQRAAKEIDSMATQNAETTGTISFRYNDKFQPSEVDFHHTVLS
jgi:cobalamin biosynthesis protein CobD/CbiB